MLNVAHVGEKSHASVNAALGEPILPAHAVPQIFMAYSEFAAQNRLPDFGTRPKPPQGAVNPHRGKFLMHAILPQPLA